MLCSRNGGGGNSLNSYLFDAAAGVVCSSLLRGSMLLLPRFCLMYNIATIAINTTLTATTGPTIKEMLLSESPVSGHDAFVHAPLRQQEE